jgi:hypothetical protein
MPAFYSKARGKSRKISIGLDGIPAETRTEHPYGVNATATRSIFNQFHCYMPELENAMNLLLDEQSKHELFPL